MSEAREQSCAERIAGHMASREADLAAIFGLVDENASYADMIRLEGLGFDAEEGPDPHDMLAEYGLGVSAKILVRVDISTGGPADYVEAVCEPTSSHAFQRRDEGGERGILAYVEPVSMTYHFADWFDHAETPIPEDSALWRWVADIVECGVAL